MPVTNFSGPLRVEESPGAKWVLIHALDYHGKRQRFHIPAGFLTDFASTPRLLWSIFPPYGRWVKAAVLHDYAYSHPFSVDGEPITRKDADGLFRRVLGEEGCPGWRANVMYWALRLFGWLAWNAARRED